MPCVEALVPGHRNGVGDQGVGVLPSSPWLGQHQRWDAQKGEEQAPSQRKTVEAGLAGGLAESRGM